MKKNKSRNKSRNKKNKYDGRYDYPRKPAIPEQKQDDAYEALGTAQANDAEAALRAVHAINEQRRLQLQERMQAINEQRRLQERMQAVTEQEWNCILL